MAVSLDYKTTQITTFPDDVIGAIRQALYHVGAVESTYTQNKNDSILWKFPGTPTRYHYLTTYTFNSKASIYSYSPTSAAFNDTEGTHSFNNPDPNYLADGTSEDTNNVYLQNDVYFETNGRITVAVLPQTLLLLSSKTDNFLLMAEFQNEPLLIKISHDGTKISGSFGTSDSSYNGYLELIGFNNAVSFGKYPVEYRGNVPVLPAVIYTRNTIYKMIDVPGIYVSTISVVDGSDLVLNLGAEQVSLRAKKTSHGAILFSKGVEIV